MIYIYIYSISHKKSIIEVFIYIEACIVKWHNCNDIHVTVISLCFAGLYI